MELTAKQYVLLCEALRRFKMFNHEKKPLTDAWTGLGSATEYAPVEKAGLMVCVGEKRRGVVRWWTLTPRGALIVAYWMGLMDGGASSPRWSVPDAIYTKGR